MSIRKTSRTRGNDGVHDEPAYVIHRYDWSETSLILELFTRNLGRVAVAAKGVKRPTSSFRSVLLPFQPLLVSLGEDAEIRRLRGVEWAGGYTMPTGEPLFVGYYITELLMRFFARHDAQSLVFDAYAQTLAVVAKQLDEQLTQPMLRTFELIVLRAAGVLPALNCETLTLNPLKKGTHYTLDPQAGLTQQSPQQYRAVTTLNAKNVQLLDSVWYPIHEAFISENILQELPLAVAPVANELKYILRNMLSHHAGVDRLYTRQLMQTLQESKATC